MFIADGSKVGGAFTRRSLFLSFVLHGVILLLAYDLLIKQKDDDKQKVKDDDIIVKVLPPDELVASVPEPPSPNNVQLPEKEPIESIGGEKNNPIAKTNAVARVKRRKPKSKHPIVKDHPINLLNLRNRRLYTQGVLSQEVRLSNHLKARKSTL